MRARQAVAVAAPAVLILYYALRGGSYDTVVAQEESLAIWWVLALGALTGLLPRLRQPRRLLIPLGLMALLAAWTALSLGWTQSDERTYAEAIRVLHYLGLLLLVSSLVGRDTWREALVGLTVGAVAVCAIALGRRLFGGTPDDPVSRLFTASRLSHPLNYWNALGAWGSATVALLAGWSIQRRPALRALPLALAPIPLAVVYLTYSRAGIGGTALALLVVVALSQRRWMAAVHGLAIAAAGAVIAVTIHGQDAIAHGTGTGGAGAVVAAIVVCGALCGAVGAGSGRLYETRAGRGRALAGVALACVVVVVVLAAEWSHVQSAWTDFKRPPAAGLVTDPATRLGNVSGTRYAIWKTAVKTFRAHPLDGTGAGTFEFDWNRSGGQESVRDAHSLYLEGLAELGIVGGALLIALVAALALAGFGRAGGAARSRDTAVVAGVSAFVVVAAQAGVDWIWESTATWVLGLLAIAIVMGRDGAERTRARVLPRLGWTLAAGVCALLTLPVLVSTSELRSSQRAAARGDLRAASQAADNAVDSEPWAASPFVQRALVEERGGRLEAALTDLRRAQSRQGYDWRIPLLRARVAAEAGHTPEALAAYRRARALRPKSVFFGPAG